MREPRDEGVSDPSHASACVHVCACLCVCEVFVVNGGVTLGVQLGYSALEPVVKALATLCSRCSSYLKNRQT